MKADSLGAVVVAGTAVATTPIDLAKLVCDDPDLLRREFDELIAASWDAPPPDRPRGPRRSPPRRPVPLARRRHRLPTAATPSAADASTPAAPARQRGPPAPVAPNPHASS